MTSKQEKVVKYTTIAGAIGHVGGLTYAFVKKKHFWGYVCFALLFGAIAGTSVYALSEAFIKDDEK
jgi:hypothetical protein